MESEFVREIIRLRNQTRDIVMTRALSWEAKRELIQSLLQNQWKHYFPRLIADLKQDLDVPDEGQTPEDTVRWWWSNLEKYLNEE